MTTRRWSITIVVVAAVIAGSIGLAAANDGGTGQVLGGMMGGTGGMMGTTGTQGTTGGMMGGTSMGGGMMTGTDMGVMHDQMMSAMAGTVPAAMLARCDKLHDQMWSATDATAGTGHASHHLGTSG